MTPGLGTPPPLTRQPASRNLLAGADLKAGTPAQMDGTTGLAGRCKGVAPAMGPSAGLMARGADASGAQGQTRSLADRGARGKDLAGDGGAVRFISGGHGKQWGHQLAGAFLEGFLKQSTDLESAAPSLSMEVSAEQEFRHCLNEGGARSAVGRGLFMANFDHYFPDKEKFGQTGDTKFPAIKRHAIGDTLIQIDAVDKAAKNYFTSAMEKPGPTALPVQMALHEGARLVGKDMSARHELKGQYTAEFSRCVYAEIADQAKSMRLSDFSADKMTPIYDKAMARMAKNPEYAPQAF